MARHAVFALGVLAAGAAEAWTLDALLRLPLARLLELQVTAQHKAQGSSTHAPQAGVVSGEGVDRAA